MSSSGSSGGDDDDDEFLSACSDVDGSGISDDEETVNSLESRDSYTRKGGRGGETGGMGISVFSTLLYVRSGFAARAERSEASGAERGERKEASETKPVPWRAKRA